MATMEIQTMNQYLRALNQQRFLAVVHDKYFTMEFEAPNIYRMRKILSDLLLSIKSALKNSPNTKSTECTTGDELSMAANGFIEHLQMFNQLMESRMKIKPIEKLERDNYLRVSIANLKGARDEVEALKSQLEDERSRHEQIVQVMTDEIAKENSLLVEIKAKHAAEIAETMKESEVQIAMIKEETDLETKRLELEIDARKIRLKDTSRGNLKHERELYAKRSKVESRYLAVLAKYDTEVGELHRTMESLTAELSCLDERLKHLRDQLAVQDVQYVELKNEREMAILKAFTEDLENFEKNRAARIIQRAWRSFYERFCMRKKKKTKKKK